jgi:hypothetical protein
MYIVYEVVNNHNNKLADFNIPAVLRPVVTSVNEAQARQIAAALNAANCGSGVEYVIQLENRIERGHTRPLTLGHILSNHQTHYN